MNDLYQVLEICLHDVEQGEDLESVLFRHPGLADELRPILETAANARTMAVSPPSAEVVRRNRAKVLQRAAEMREVQTRPSLRRFWLASVRRVAVTLVVSTALFVSGTGLVRAASTTIPGDNLYPVKRTWENVLVLFTFNVQQREALEVEHENERLSELHDLFAEKRSASVDFAGLVSSQDGSRWVIAGVPVSVSAQTELDDSGIGLGSPVRVQGQTQADGTVLAERIELLPPGATLPDAAHEQEREQEHQEDSKPQIEDHSGRGSGDDTSSIEETKVPGTESQPNNETENSGSGSEHESGSTPESHDSGGSDDGGSHDSGEGHSSPEGGGGDH